MSMSDLKITYPLHDGDKIYTKDASFPLQVGGNDTKTDRLVAGKCTLSQDSKLLDA